MPFSGSNAIPDGARFDAITFNDVLNIFPT